MLSCSDIPLFTIFNNSTEFAGGEEVEKLEGKKNTQKHKQQIHFEQLGWSCTFKEKVWYLVVNFTLKIKCRNRCNISKTTT